jgi:hypothetical protein
MSVGHIVTAHHSVLVMSSFFVKHMFLPVCSIHPDVAGVAVIDSFMPSPRSPLDSPSARWSTIWVGSFRRIEPLNHWTWDPGVWGSERRFLDPNSYKFFKGQIKKSDVRCIATQKAWHVHSWCSFLGVISRKKTMWDVSRKWFAWHVIDVFFSHRTCT